MKNRILNYFKYRIRNVVRDEIHKYDGGENIFDRIKCSDSYYLASTLDQLADINLWWADIKFSDDLIKFNGWAIVPTSMQKNVAFTVNNVLCDDIDYPVCSPGLGRIYYFKPNSAMCGFNCVKSIKGNRFIKKDNHIIFNIVDKRTLLPLEGYSNIHSEPGELDTLPVPDDSNLARIGAKDLLQYKTVGFGQLMRLQEALVKYTNKSYADFGRILDWGCGCGRILRYFNRYNNVEVHGVDIDSVNINWCKSNLSFANFQQVPLTPPTNYSDGYFDLIIGISVVTHLRETDQSAWLAELSRITREGGLILLSTHGNGGVAFRNELFDINKLFSWQEKGFLTIGVDNAINDSIDDKEYYTTSFQTERYIKKEWAKYFHIIDVIPSFIGHFQDLVVMQKF
jgi:2-polyprenyl-3-methyl-5-hydroxy-6-metoxy-1,4-benzoquinol methylase